MHRKKLVFLMQTWMIFRVNYLRLCKKFGRNYICSSGYRKCVENNFLLKNIFETCANKLNYKKISEYLFKSVTKFSVETTCIFAKTFADCLFSTRDDCVLNEQRTCKVDLMSLCKLPSVRAILSKERKMRMDDRTVHRIPMALRNRNTY